LQRCLAKSNLAISIPEAKLRRERVECLGGD